ncbi:retrovirus-related Pol polyprotein from transposon 297 [Trichonephila clavipes]|nr:retrovirus-related Pol polyprotein from transposon 297 [Trichonephila clavipes]
MKNSSEGIDSEMLYSVKLLMDFGFQGNLRKSQLYFKLPPDRSSYLRMINAKKKERFLPGPGTIVLRRKDINLVTGKPFRIKTCCSSQILINLLREDTKYLLDLGVNGMGQSNRTLPVVWLGRVNRYPYLRIKCMKYRNLNQVTRAEIYLLLKRERLVGKINAASWVTVLDLWKWYFRRSLMMNYPKHTTCVMPVGMYIIKKSRFKFLSAYDECNLMTRILRLLEPIEVPRMVDIDILMEIWKNRVKKIDFVLKWLSRVGSEVGPTKGFCEGDTRNRSRWTSVSRCGQGTMAPWARQLGCVLACYAPIGRRRRGDGERDPEKKKRGGDPKGEVGEKSSEKRRADRLRKRRGESQSFLLCDADQESETRMSKNALRTGRRQAVE